MNVTVALPDEIAKAARHLAVDRGISLSRFVAKMIEDAVGSEQWRIEARERRRRMMAEGFNLGTNGKITGTRDDLHER